jgi:hypothetical protein
MKQHPHAEILRAIADGEPLENFEVHYTHWHETDWRCSRWWASWVFHPEAWQVRRKQKTIMVNGFVVPEPVREQPKDGAEYWTPTLQDANYASGWTWLKAGDAFDNNALKRGLIHLTKEAAVAHAKAMLGIDPKEQA